MVLAILAVAAPAKAADLFLNDEPEVYAAIDKLSALGYLPGFLANTRPYSIQAVRAAAETAWRKSVPEGFDGDLLRWLLSYSAPTAMGRVTAAGSHSDVRFIPPNNEGLPRPEGWAAQGSIAARGEATPYLSGQLRAASFWGKGDDEGNRLLDTSLEVGHKYASLQAGKISTWYGPGRNGALIFTNNAAPYPGVRIHNQVPIPLSGWFSFLGSVQYDLFGARMEKKEAFSHSILVGTRLAARPGNWLEIGVSRAMHYGGDGRSNGLSEFLKAYGGNNDPSTRSNTLAGFDITVTLPFKFQPVQAYWDRAGEGDNRLLGTGIPWTSQWGNILGLYFPKVLGESRLDLRAEYADTYSGYAKTANWYFHPAYSHFYRGDVLGHPMGGGSRDWFVESRYFFHRSSFASVSYERILHDRGVAPSIGFSGERRSRVSAGLTGWLTDSWRGEAHASADRVTDRGGVQGVRQTDVSGWLAISYQGVILSQ
ncbi:MAG: capsule assembly Wzi family protein [Candidatus Deferrimicrobiaceae bacterium]